jgi:hypothetical protein
LRHDASVVAGCLSEQAASIAEGAFPVGSDYSTVKAVMRRLKRGAVRRGRLGSAARKSSMFGQKAGSKKKGELDVGTDTGCRCAVCLSTSEKRLLG